TKCDNPHSVALDFVADLTGPDSDFEMFLSQRNYCSPVLALQRGVIGGIILEWANLPSRFQQLCPDNANFDDVNSIRRGVLLEDDIADYVSKVVLS
ncbi:hypothetical protein BGZ54_004299, partial [Gamsiella multidivaricata]